ncbi:bacteriohemerythrin [Pontiella sulfatireligans]|uniref:Bacteriohemerythrin n=1 Tax=Pontiella sulfatireligans TaxID=2750658 RepID=A0A6C2UM11_9BACT|nr:bacteriohemerythrin [Pontiella sulfatireligans]VGO21009.1 Bacteriohemerythrin [Pontiella sulfatireligans]
MNEVKWTDDLSVGVELIDDQHKELIQRLNNLTKAVEQQHGPNEIPDTLSFLIDYTDFHFSMEERNMKAHGYPAFEAHKAKHEEFKTILAYMESEFRDDGPTAVLAESIETLLVNWLLKHIRGVDVKFGAFLKENGIAISENE